MTSCISGPPRSHYLHPNKNKSCISRLHPKKSVLLPLPSPQPLRVPMSEVVYTNVSDSSSDTDCESISTGLCEVLPPDLQSSCVQGSDERNSSSVSTTARQEPYTEGVVSIAQQNSTTITTGSEASRPSDIHTDEQFSEVASPFASHSDPFQFTVRLPRSVKEPWSGPVVGDYTSTSSTPPPWDTIRRESQATLPSTDYIFRRTVSQRHDMPSLWNAAETAKDLTQHPVVSQYKKYLSNGCVQLHYHLR